MVYCKVTAEPEVRRQMLFAHTYATVRCLGVCSLEGS